MRHERVGEAAGLDAKRVRARLERYDERREERFAREWWSVVGNDRRAFERREGEAALSGARRDVRERYEREVGLRIRRVAARAERAAEAPEEKARARRERGVGRDERDETGARNALTQAPRTDGGERSTERDDGKSVGDRDDDDAGREDLDPREPRRLTDPRRVENGRERQRRGEDEATRGGGTDDEIEREVELPHAGDGRDELPERATTRQEREPHREHHSEREETAGARDGDPHGVSSAREDRREQRKENEEDERRRGLEDSRGAGRFEHGSAAVFVAQLGDAPVHGGGELTAVVLADVATLDARTVVVTVVRADRHGVTRPYRLSARFAAFRTRRSPGCRNKNKTA